MEPKLQEILFGIIDNLQDVWLNMPFDMDKLDFPKKQFNKLGELKSKLIELNTPPPSE